MPLLLLLPFLLDSQLLDRVDKVQTRLKLPPTEDEQEAVDEAAACVPARDDWGRKLMPLVSISLESYGWPGDRRLIFFHLFFHPVQSANQPCCSAFTLAQSGKISLFPGIACVLLQLKILFQVVDG